MSSSMSNSSTALTYNHDYSGGGGGESTELAQEATPGGGSSTPAGFGLFSVDLKKNEDLMQMLESNKDSAKLEAMKRIVGMISHGKNASELFPAVVKNVASKNIEIKKLVYVYLVRYAEEQQDLALLSIATFQRGLKDPNQLIRASALRVLSSIRVPIIVPIMMLAIKEASADLSPYVRKTAAHAIQKLYSLDPEQKDLLIEIIEKLLKDKSTLVAGSVVMAFEEVCPDRIDLIHKNYRKLCNLLVDVEEWGQVVIIHMLTRYARTQFVSPWKEEESAEDATNNFYGSDEENEKETNHTRPYVMDPDHRLLLRNTKPLLQSRNAAVVMAVVQLYWHLAPKSETSTVAKSLVRLLRSHREVQYIVLQNIATMSIQRKGLFEPFLKSFYVRSTDPTMIKTLKLEILTNLANEANVSTLLREFQTYVKSQDKQFAAATIQAIGRCATNISAVTDTCLNGLVYLLSNRDDIVVAESVVVIKKLLQTQPTQHSEIIKHMAKLLGKITVPMARASILWLIGEYCERVPKIAPDVLRKMAKSFTNEDDLVKLQILNLAAKLYLTNSKQTKLLTQYILSLGKYDQNYDIRDRTRFVRQLIVPNEKSGALSKYAKRIFLVQKPAPILESPFKDRDRFQLGTLSHTLNTKASGYLELTDWPEVAPDPCVRNVEVVEPVCIFHSVCVLKKWKKNSIGAQAKIRGISVKKIPRKVSCTDNESGSEEGSDDQEGSSSEESDASSASEEDESDDEKYSKKGKKSKSDSESEDEKDGSAVESEGSSSSDDSSDSESASDSEDDNDHKPQAARTVTSTKKVERKPAQDNKPTRKKDVSLLDLDDFTSLSTPVAVPKPAILSPSLIGDLQGLSLSTSSPVINVCTAPFVPTTTHELLHRMSGKGLSAHYYFPRLPCIFGTQMVSVQITFTNTSEKEIEDIHIAEKKTDLKMHMFSPVDSLEPEGSITVSMGIDFCDSTQTASFQLCTKDDQFSVGIQPPPGELLLPVTMSEADHRKEQAKLTGMNEHSATITVSPHNSTPQIVVQKFVAAANLGVVASGQNNVYRFAAKTVHSGSLMLVTVELKEASTAQLIINTEKTVIGSILLRELKPVLSQG
ncbi:LOW QUALITY PROTEIN: AP-3 complex subunit beta-1 [Mixophyes fleayi]|uniref:LOW QUALITY PROTEIN: AP-3 complex subunit beta-1 n=1 Tax=Mixophyes fleayi TaxID=3061075 RepID=UPI003F4D7847